MTCLRPFQRPLLRQVLAPIRLSVVLLFFMTSVAIAETEFTLIAKESEPAPGSFGNFDLSFGVSSFPALIIDDNGNVYFWDTVNTAERGIWWGSGSIIDYLAVDFQMLPGFLPSEEDCEGFGPTCGQVWNIREGFYVTPAGQIILRVNRDDNIGRIAQLGGTSRVTLEPLVTSVQVPTSDFPTGVGLQTAAGQFQIGRYAGIAAFGSSTGGLENFADALIGTAAPSIPGDIPITDIHPTQNAIIDVLFGLNATGDRLFIAELQDASEALYFDSADPEQPFRLLARTLDPTPGIGNGAYFQLASQLTAGTTGNAQINDVQQGVFMASWRDPLGPDNNSNLPRHAIWSFGPTGTPALIISEHLDLSDPVFATSEFARTSFEGISRPRIAPDGNVYFIGTGRDTTAEGFPVSGDDRKGLWRLDAAGGGIGLILRQQTTTVSGTLLPDGKQFTSFGFGLYGIDEHGHLVFDTVDAVYAEDDSGLHLVFEKGQTIELEPGDMRAVERFRINNDSFVGNSLLGYRNHRLAFRVRFADGVNAILRTGPAPPPPPELAGLEAVQVIQDWENSVTLYANKPTLVRAHLRSEQPRALPRSRFRLRVFGNDGAELPFSPLQPNSSSGAVSVVPDSMADRGTSWHSVDFTMPLEVVRAGSTSGIQVQVEMADESLFCNEQVGLLLHDCALELEFTEPRVPELRLFSMNWKKRTDAENVERVNLPTRIDLVRRLISLYPVSQVKWSTVETPYSKTVLGVPDLHVVTDVRSQMIRRRALDKCSTGGGCQRMYYGALSKRSLAGIAQLPGHAGAGFVHPDPRAQGRHTHSHEIGHNLDRHHSVADPKLISLTESGSKRGPCGSVASVKRRNFLHMHNIEGLGLRQTLGPMDEGESKLVYGYDSLQGLIIDPKRHFDLMGYCSVDVIDMWPSNYTYAELAAYIEERFSPSESAALAAFGAAEDYWLLGGTIEPGGVTLEPLLRLAMVQPPDVSAPGTYQVRVVDATDQVLTMSSFAPDVAHARGLFTDSVSFFVALTVQPGARRIEVIDPEGTLIAELTASDNPPVVEITSPNGGEMINAEMLAINWLADDPDGDALTHSVQLSKDGGQSWETLVTDWPGQSLEIPAASLAQTSQALIRVQTTDGFHIAEDVSDGLFSLPNSSPAALITRPEVLRSFFGDDPIELSASAFDAEDGPLNGMALEWFSDLDGPIGQGDSLLLSATAFTPGTHLITVIATDGDGASGEDSISMTVGINPPSPMADISTALLIDTTVPPPAREPHMLRLHIENAGPDAVDDADVGLDILLTNLVGGPVGAASMQIISHPPDWNCQTGNFRVQCLNVALEAFSMSDIELAIVVDGPAVAKASATAESVTPDPAAGNNFATAEYEVDPGEHVFLDGFEPESVQL